MQPKEGVCSESTGSGCIPRENVVVQETVIEVEVVIVAFEPSSSNASSTDDVMTSTRLNRSPTNRAVCRDTSGNAQSSRKSGPDAASDVFQILSRVGELCPFLEQQARCGGVASIQCGR